MVCSSLLPGGWGGKHHKAGINTISTRTVQGRGVRGYDLPESNRTDKQEYDEGQHIATAYSCVDAILTYQRTSTGRSQSHQEAVRGSAS